MHPKEASPSRCLITPSLPTKTCPLQLPPPPSLDAFTTQASVLLFGSFSNFYSTWYTIVSMAISLWYVLTHVSWLAIVACLVYCGGASVVSSRVIAPVAARTFSTSAALGNLRFLYARMQVRVRVGFVRVGLEGCRATRL